MWTMSHSLLPPALDPCWNGLRAKILAEKLIVLALTSAQISWFFPKKSNFLVFFKILSVLCSLLTTQGTHPLSSFILFPHIFCTPSKISTSHMPVTHPPIFVFKTNKLPLLVSPFPGVTILSYYYFIYQ